jgi:Fur family zinc uptake transcriptional regulator
MKVLREFVPNNHKHSACIADALARAELICHEGGYRLTPVRRRVLELVWSSHEPVKAYDLLSKLQSEKRTAAPPTIYRALDFLLDLGFVHKIESLNAYMGCGDPGHKGSGQLLICQNCSEVAELDDDEIRSLLTQVADKLGFEISTQTIEIKGKCAKCLQSVN